METLHYTYNIHGWLLGINPQYAVSGSQYGHFFGMELGYDKPGAAGFANAQVNGNIAGNAWKTSGDNISRKYDYHYDNVNQLAGADFRQKNDPGAGWTKDKMDFSSEYSYDENGNIKTQNQWGVSPGSAPQQIDQLAYNYDLVTGGWTNRLRSIQEGAAAGANGNLGDFKNGAAGGNAQQYTYDPNGNQLKDLNKEIGNAATQGITYNYMNLPVLITFKNTNKTIAYVYDAAGNKLRKILDEPANGSIPARHVETDYLNGFVYQGNELQFFTHEEGRIRKALDGTFVYDYFIKDHLGNTRMIITEEQQVDWYPTATLEGTGTGSALSNEQDYYDINGTYVVDKPMNVNPSNLLNYINDNGTNNPNTFGNKNTVSQKMYRLNGATNRTGYSKILKVMAGDRIDILAKSYYHFSGSVPSPNDLLAVDIISAFLGVAGGGNAALQHGASGAILNNNTAGLVVPLGTFSNNNTVNLGNGVKAGLNYVILDEGFNFVSGGYDPVKTDVDGGFKNHYLPEIEIPKNGYIYIYCSNESNIDVFFDNLEVVHIRGHVLEENHYYSYGLKIAAISSKAAGTLQTNYLYQGAFSEYDADAGYNEFYLRHYDAQTGRWTTMDSKSQFSNPYLGMNNNPIITIDVDGGWGWPANTILGAVGGGVIGGLIAEANGGKFWEGATIGGIYGAGIGAAVSYGLNLNGIQEATSNMPWNIVSNALLTASINLTTKLLQEDGVKAAAVSGLIGLGTGSLTSIIRGKKYEGEDRAEIRKDELRQYKSIIIGNTANGLFDRLSLSLIQDRKSPYLNAIIGLGEGLLSGIGTSFISQGAMSSFNQNLLSSVFTATPGLSLRSAIGGSFLLATGLGILSAEGDLFENLSPSWNRLIGIGVFGAELYSIYNLPKITLFLSNIDYPDYFKRFK